MKKRKVKVKERKTIREVIKRPILLKKNARSKTHGLNLNVFLQNKKY